MKEQETKTNTKEPKKSWLKNLFSRKKKDDNINTVDAITIYAIYHSAAKDLDLENLHNSSKQTPIYYTATKEDAVEAVSRALYVDHISHFKLWLTLHDDLLKSNGVDPENAANFKYNSTAWCLYLQAIFPNSVTTGKFEIPDSDRYSIVSMKYSPREVATFLRTLAAVHPLGMPAETPEEIANFLLFLNINGNPFDIPEALDALSSSDPAFLLKLAQAVSMTYPAFEKDGFFEGLKNKKSDTDTNTDTDGTA